MKKDIQQIIKAATERYGLFYDPSSDFVKVELLDGTIQNLGTENLASVFGVNPFQTGWSKVPNENVEWSKQSFKITLEDNLSVFDDVINAA